MVVLGRTARFLVTCLASAMLATLCTVAARPNTGAIASASGNTVASSTPTALSPPTPQRRGAPWPIRRCAPAGCSWKKGPVRYGTTASQRSNPRMGVRAHSLGFTRVRFTMDATRRRTLRDGSGARLLTPSVKVSKSPVTTKAATGTLAASILSAPTPPPSLHQRILAITVASAGPPGSTAAAPTPGAPTPTIARRTSGVSCTPTSAWEPCGPTIPTGVGGTIVASAQLQSLRRTSVFLTERC
mmetsp:Transcript_20849/g.45812  ORF Transcript_20849/g.45812 Transcript_20849/m.45812 type:complete len:243 (+) Transcript_20849:2302-3030(+)